MMIDLKLLLGSMVLGPALLLSPAAGAAQQSGTPRAAEAATRWSLKWMVWMQDLLLTYGVVG